AMSEGERGLFEQEVAQDPLLKAEFDLQRDVIEALKDTRHAELKTRLQNVPTPGTGVISIPAQFIGGALLVGAALITGYLLINDGSTDSQSDENFITLTADNILITAEKAVPSRPEVAIWPGKKQPTGTAEPTRDSDLLMANNASNESTKSEETVRTEEPVTANIDLPTLMDEDDSDGEAIGNTRIELPESGLDPLEEDLTENVEITHLPSESNNLQYRFYNSKLYLYGSFGEVPYEILEINGKKGKSYYLYHNELYYRLNYDQVDPTPLREITNKRIVRELDIVRKNK
ncbi:MAG: hypothetical protein WBH03_10855, partial [Cyclobacteriaceae bacterium]